MSQKTKTVSSPLSPDSSLSSSVPTEELKSRVHVVLKRIEVDTNGNVAKSSKTVNIDSDDDFVNDEEVRNTIFPLIHIRNIPTEFPPAIEIKEIFSNYMHFITNERI